MKLAVATTLILSCLTSHAAAFSAVAPPSSSSAASTGSPDPVDRSMRGIDDQTATNTDDGPIFDPTEGDNPALIRNNNDQVWVPQVRLYVVVVVNER